MYYLYSFGSNILPQARASYDSSTPAALNPMLATIGGGYDVLSAASALLATPYTISHTGLLRAANITALATLLDGWRAAVGSRGTLTRRTFESSPVSQTVSARLIQVQTQTEPVHKFGVFQPATFLFSTTDEFWQAIIASSAPVALDASPKTLTVTTTGNAPVRDAVVTITAQTSAITAVTVAISGVAEWTYSGSIAATESLVVDCGARTVRTGAGADVYSDFALGNNHASADWLPLAVGENTVTITKTGGGATSTCAVTYSQKYV